MRAVWAVIWGATWGNNMAAIEWALAAGIIGGLERDRIGRALAAWWARHHGPHAIEQHLEALRRHEATPDAGRPGSPDEQKSLALLTVELH